MISLVGLSGVMLTWQAIDPKPWQFAGLSIDRLSAVLTLLVATVGAVTYDFSLRYLDGDPSRRRFLRRLAFTILSAYVLMLADHLLVLFLAWSLTSFGLHRLLLHDPNRDEARRPARKKFLISRLGDLALIAAIFLIHQAWGVHSISSFLKLMAYENDPAVTWVGVLVVVAALTKSAQFPFHSWLPETMEAPTPVSALMHAGIINAGGALLLRFAPLIGRVPLALFLLSLIGTITVAIGLPAMWAQVKVKRSLAWSTVSQMGFMMIQCGLGAFPAAGLHILGHGFYKAWSFLRSAQLPETKGSPVEVDPNRKLLLLALGISGGIPALWFASSVTGFEPWHSPGEMALSAIVAISLGQLWVAMLGASFEGVFDGVRRIAATILFTLAAAMIAFGLYRFAGSFLEPVVGELQLQAGWLAWAAAVMPVAAILTLSVLQIKLAVIGRKQLGKAFYVHALNGFYFGVIADRLVDTVWNFFAVKEVERA